MVPQGTRVKDMAYWTAKEAEEWERHRRPRPLSKSERSPRGKVVDANGQGDGGHGCEAKSSDANRGEIRDDEREEVGGRERRLHW